MKKFEYKQYDYAFLYGLFSRKDGMLTEKQKESLNEVLERFIGYPNTESTKFAAKMAMEDWIRRNDIKIDGDLKLNFM